MEVTSTVLTYAAGAKGIIFSSILALLQVVRASDWTVETNSLQVKEPSHLQGIYDVAIGDVDFSLTKHSAEFASETVHMRILLL